MRLALALALSSSAVLTAAPSPARADCASPHWALSPRPGSTLPADPTLYLFLAAPYDGSPQTELGAVAGGEALPVQVAVASQTEALTVLRITVQTGDHRSMTLRPLTALKPWEAHFTVAPSRRRVTRTPVRLRSARHERDEWTCSFTDAWLLSPAAEADAYRVDWAATPSAWGRGEQTSAIFPRNEMDLWSRPDEARGAAPRPPSIALGHVSCFAYTIPEQAVRGPLYVKVTGLYADGSETPAWQTPRRLDAAGMESSPPTGQPPAAPAAVTPPAAASPSRWPATAGLAGLAGLMLVVAALRLRRAPPRVAPPPR